MKIHWKQVVPFFLLGLLLGAAFGSWAHRAALRKFRGGGPKPNHARMFERLSRQLALDEGQRTAIRAVMDGQRAQMQALQQRNAQEFEAQRLAFKTEILKSLRPEQRERFEAFTARWEKRQRRGPGGGMMPPPPPPPPEP
ncbi:MAG TPA: hypothetical protein DCM05_04275 [Elusimicrobia bacterium]|nr:hypothetical protein [Elusimicrobiota bacterium]